VPTPELFVLVGRVHKGHNPEKSVPGSSPSEDGFFGLEIKQDRMVPSPELFVSTRRLQVRELELEFICIP
jgi:hypothetical protein